MEAVRLQRWAHAEAPHWLAFGLVYLVLAWAGQQLALAPELGVAAWPPAGLLIALLIHLPRHRQAGYLAAAFMADMTASVGLYGFPPSVSFTIAVGNLLESIVGSVALRRWAAGSFSFKDIRSAIAFIGICGGMAPVCSMLLGGTIVGLHTGQPLLDAWRLWWTGDSVGILIVAPFVLAFRSGSWARFKAAGYVRHGDLLGLIVTLVVLGHLCFAHPAPVAFLMLPPLIWAALRHGAAGSSLAASIVFSQAVLYSGAGLGPFAAMLSLPQAQVVAQVFGMVTAVTGLVLAGASTHARQAMLEATKLVKERTAALRERETQLEQSMLELRTVDERKDNFLAVLAHELINPLAAIRNGITISERTLDLAQARSVREMMNRQTALLGALVTDLMDVARLKQGKVSIKMTRVLLDSAVRDAMAAIEARFAAKLQVIDYEPPGAALAVRADAHRFVQILVNLLGNVTRHCPEGSIVRIRCGNDVGRAWVSIADNGPGIPPEKLPAIFDIYQQGERNASEGLGIGLALVKQLVDLHGGDITVHSEVRKGTSFTVRLALA